MNTNVIVHVGYHKTGTTSLQDFLHANAKALEPHFRFYGKADFLRAGANARIYAQRPFPWRLFLFRRALRRFLDTVTPGGTTVLSRETFSGGMPGHRKIGGALMMSYTKPAHKLAQVIIAELRRKFGQDTDITFFYTTREREAWIKSVHGHLLRSIQLTDDFDTFRARFSDLKGPEAEAAQMAKLLNPIPVMTAALEDHAKTTEGPAAVLLDMMNVPADLRATLKPAGRSNIGQADDMRTAFLDLNRQNLSKPDLKSAKDTAIAAAKTSN